MSKLHFIVKHFTQLFVRQSSRGPACDMAEDSTLRINDSKNNKKPCETLSLINNNETKQSFHARGIPPSKC